MHINLKQILWSSDVVKKLQRVHSADESQLVSTAALRQDSAGLSELGCGNVEEGRARYQS